jgi:hypothetical protein
MNNPVRLTGRDDRSPHDRIAEMNPLTLFLFTSLVLASMDFWQSARPAAIVGRRIAVAYYPYVH